MDLKNNTILITGGTSGIGWELAQQLFKRGNTIIVTGRDSAKLEKVKRENPKIATIRSDVSQAKDIEFLYSTVVKEFPDTNILINNAGFMKVVNMHDQSTNLTELVNEIETNLMGPIRMVREFLPLLKTKSQAAIMNVSSGLAFTPLPIAPVYCATKAALHSFTLSLRVQLKNTKIKVFELAPPATKTELLGRFDSEDMKGISIMPVSDMVSAAVKGMERDQLEIRPGQSNQLKFMSRLAPEFILNQMSGPVERMLNMTKQ